MATEKYFVFSESGELKRMKGRIVRFLDNEDPTGSDKDAIRTSLEVSPDAAGLVQADVGTAPNEIPVNGMLGDMAYQSSDGVSAAKIEVESTTGTATTQALTVTDGTDTNFVVQEDGKTGIGTASPSSYYSASDDLVIAGASNRGISIIAGATSSSSIAFGSGTGTDAYRGKITYDNNSHSLSFNTLSATRWLINSSGNLVSNGAYGIDFGSTNTTAGVTVTGSTLDHYEEGTWTVTTNSDATGVIGASDAVYTRIGNIVTVRATFTVTTNFTSNQIGGLPYLPATNSISNSTSGTPVLTASATSSPIIAHVLGNSNTVRFTSGTNLGTTHALNTTHASYRVFLTYNV